MLILLMVMKKFLTIINIGLDLMIKSNVFLRHCNQSMIKR